MATSSTTPPSPAGRAAYISRDTNETKIQISIDLDGGALPQKPSHDKQEKDDVDGTRDPDEKQEQLSTHASQKSGSRIISVDTGIGFLDHMLHALAKHAGWSLWVRAKGDLHSKEQLHFPSRISPSGTRTP